jgi:hypothetical protein
MKTHRYPGGEWYLRGIPPEPELYQPIRFHLRFNHCIYVAANVNSSKYIQPCNRHSLRTESSIYISIGTRAAQLL